MEQLHLLYKNRGYFDRYGGDVMISLLLIVLTVMLTGYANYQSIMAEVQRNWNQHRCNPIYMPFAGVIMPQAGMSVTETTTTNFAYCIKQDASAVFSIAMMPFEFGMYLAGSFYALFYKHENHNATSVLDSLDAQILYDKVLFPLLGIEDLRNDERIDYIPGKQSISVIKDLIDEGEFEVGFMLYPSDINEIKALADNNLIMPPKSTYIEPKFRSGLVVYEL